MVASVASSACLEEHAEAAAGALEDVTLARAAAAVKEEQA